VLPLVTPQGSCIETPNDEGSSRDDVLFGRDRSPLAMGSEGQVSMLPVGRAQFVPVASLSGSTLLAWARDGAWLATWSQRDGTRLHRVDSDATLGQGAVTALPSPPALVGEVEQLFPFPEHGWIAARTELGNVVLWHRGAAERWEPPVVLDEPDLRIGREWTEVDLRDGGRTLVVGEQAISLDPDRLTAQAPRLLSSRWSQPASPAR
jgi:hypothetical protein